MPPTCCGRWVLPIEMPSAARYMCSNLIGEPRRFKWCAEPAGLRSWNCDMSHTLRSFHHASLKMFLRFFFNLRVFIKEIPQQEEYRRSQD